MISSEKSTTPRFLNVVQINKLARNLVKILYSGNKRGIFEMLNLPNIGQVLNTPDFQGNTLIHHAVSIGKIEIVRKIIQKGGIADILDSGGHNILYHPIRLGNYEMIKAILEETKKRPGVPLVNMKDDFYAIPLHFAIKQDNRKIVELLIDNGSDLSIVNKDNGNNSLMLAIILGKPDISRYICRKSSMECLRTVNNNDKDPLFLAVIANYYELCLALLSRNVLADSMSQDQEVIPLHFACYEGNPRLIRLLIDYGANYNIQTAQGESCLHILVKYNHEDCLEELIDQPNLNFNMWNSLGNLPLHSILKKMDKSKKKKIYEDEYDSDFYSTKLNPNKEYSQIEIMKIFLDKTNISFQNEEGITCLHYICKMELWKIKELQKILRKKKMEIFRKEKTPNKSYKQGMAPIDYVQHEDMKEFLGLVVDSYIYKLQLSRNNWINRIDNICSREYTADVNYKVLGEKIVDDSTLFSACKSKVYNKLVSLCETYYETGNLPFHKTGIYPPKQGKGDLLYDDVSLAKTPGVFSPFIGTELDVLISLIYILERNNNACSILDIETSKEATAASTTMKVQRNDEILSYEILWYRLQLYLPSSFDRAIKRCLLSKKRFVIIPLGIIVGELGHANGIIIDKQTNEIERFEPHGSHAMSFSYNPDDLDEKLQKALQIYFPNAAYFAPKKYLPRIGFQATESREIHEKHYLDPDGYCVIWCMFYTQMRLKNSFLSRNSLIKKILEFLKVHNKSFRNEVRELSFRITEFRDEILQKGNIDINSWLNDNYRDEDYAKSFREMKNRIRNINQNM